ncbi:hypothetical protein MMC15_006707 [Xylographa vitiligo]|nr:hypothetical protein [Xylographa vitiligo]
MFDTERHGTPIPSAVIGFKDEPVEITIKMLNLLDKMGIPTFVIGGSHYTPLHAAAVVSSLKEVVDWLMNKAGMLLMFPDIVDRLPLHLAIFRGNWDLATEILKRTMQDPSLTELTLGHKDKQGLTGLHYAAISSSPFLIAKILELDNQVTRDLINEPDHDGWTPLCWPADNQI